MKPLSSILKLYYQKGCNLNKTSDIYDRLKLYFEAKTDKELADFLEMNLNTLKTWIQREKVPYEKLHSITQNETVSFNWLLTGKGTMFINEDSQHSMDTMCELNKLPQKVSAGHGEECHDEECEVFLVPKSLFRTPIKPDEYAVMEVMGDSMEPTITDGNYVIFKKIVDFEGDGLYIIRKGNDLFVKRIIKEMDGSILIKSDNKNYPDMTPPKGDTEFRYIIGRVKAILPRIDV